MSNSNAKSTGIGLSGAMFLLFLALRLTDHIGWAWYWIAAPLWMPLGLVIGVVAIVFLCIGIALPFAWLLDRRRARKRARARKARDARRGA